MWPFKRKHKVDVVGNPVEINPPPKSPKAIQRNEQRIKAITEAMQKPKCTGEVRQRFESELRRRDALKKFWENS